MDFLRNAYSTASDEDEDKSGRPALPPSIRPKPGYLSTSFKSFAVTRPNYAPNHPIEAPLPGRYISKREQAVLASAPPADPNALPIISSPGSSSDSDIQHDILSSLRHQRKGLALFSQLPERLSVSLAGHDKAVDALQWSTTHHENYKKARVLSHHTATVKDVKWSELGLSVLSCGYDCTSGLIDIEKGLETQVFKED